jgi:hypothetical protein
MRRRLTALAIAVAATLVGVGDARAHHSFAVFFDGDKTVTINGVVKDFEFANPHGLIDLLATTNGKPVDWRVETNAPVLLRRRGWTKDSIKVGDKITIEGWAARDGSNYLRLRRAMGPDGTPIGSAFVPGEQK